MIFGIGSDLIDVAPHRASDRAPRRAVSRSHLHAASSAPRRTAAPIASETYAKRFAAKEACAKALGTGFRRGVFWRDMGVVNLPSGRPTMQLTGGALARLQGDHAAGLRGADRPVAHRRRPDGAGHCHHFGGAELTKVAPAMTARTNDKETRVSMRDPTCLSVPGVLRLRAHGMAAATRSPGRVAR